MIRQFEGMLLTVDSLSSSEKPNVFNGILGDVYRAQLTDLVSSDTILPHSNSKSVAKLSFFLEYKCRGHRYMTGCVVSLWYLGEP